MINLPERIAAKIVVDPGTACWHWTGGGTGNGYGVTHIDGSSKLAHRAVYEILVGPIPTGLQLDHLCRVRGCCNPTHLEPVTNRENGLRGQGLPAIRSRQTACVNGHAFDEPNTIIRRDGTRKCRECTNVGRRVSYWQRKRIALEGSKP